jgi:hypothetical protein
MKTKFTITDIYSPPKMKKKKLTMKELLQLQKKKKEKAIILHLEEKKRGFTMAELSPQQVMRKKIKNKIIDTHASPPKHARTLPPKHAQTLPPKHAQTSPPKHAQTLPPKHARTSPPKHVRITNRKFLIEDVPLSPKQTRLANRKFSIEDVHLSPKQTRLANKKILIEDIPSPDISESISPTPCCKCNRIMKKGDKTPDDCVWCQLKFHLHKCTKKNATERKRVTQVTQVTQKQMKTFVQNMKRITI